MLAMSLDINTIILLNHLSEYNNRQDFDLRTCKSIHYTHLQELRKQMCAKIANTKKAIERGKINLEIFLPALVNIEWCIELLWLLGAHLILNVSEFFKSINREPYASNLAQDLVDIYFNEENGSYWTSLRKYMTLEMAASLCKDECIFLPLKNQLLLSKFVDLFCGRLAKENDYPNNKAPLLDCAVDTLKTMPLIMALLINCLRDGGTTSKMALAGVDMYHPREGTSSACFLIKAVEFLKGTDFASYLLEFLIGCHNESKINWRNFSLVLHTALKENPSFYKAIINGLLDHSLKHSSSWHLYAVFVMGRICSLKSSSLNMTYLQWFSSTFSSDSNRPLDSDAKARFFLKAMSEALYLEPTGFTKVHIHKVASVPSTCQSDLGEYLQIARSYLISMNQSVELGFFENADEHTSPGDDVTSLIAFYRTYKKFPQHFLSSINFRRQYFERDFLPKLMSSCGGLSSDHHTVLKQLAGMGKISASIIAKHNELCSQKSICGK